MNEENEDLNQPQPVEIPPTTEEKTEKPIEPEPKPKVPPPPKKKEPIGFWRRTLRWTLGLLIAFALGALLVVLLLYVPARDQTRQANEQLQAANQQISQLQDRINSLQSLETKNQDLQQQNDQAQLHIAILKSQNDVANARLALANKDAAAAQMALSKTPDSLQKISGLLSADQRDVVKSMQQRLTLATGELKSNNFAAESDLNVLQTGLLQLENNLFGAR